MNVEVLKNFRAYEVTHFQIETLKVESAILKANPLKDPFVRFNPVLVPQTQGPWPVVIVLSGLFGNGSSHLNFKFNEPNSVSVIDAAVARGEAPEALYVFIDAMTSWAGSQFINSAATGLYEDYIMQEVIPALKKTYPVSNKASEWCVTGGSSGGYGALHLGSKYPEVFGLIGAIAPDSFFEASLLPEMYQALPVWEKYKESGLKALEELRNGKLMKHRNGHTLANAFAMAACYCPRGTEGDFILPLDTYTAEKKADVWNRYLQHDPLYFLAERVSGLKKLSGIHLDVGTKDNFHLQYGARQISLLLKKHGIPHEHVEFDGTHWDIGERRIEVWKWLSGQWRV